MARPTYFFGDGRSDGNAGMKALLGARGALRCEMTNLGVPVAPGFCITPKCLQHNDKDEGVTLPEGARNDIKLALSELENVSDRRFGNLADPLLLSIQGDVKTCSLGSGGTIENIGLNDIIAQAWTAQANPRFVWDSYRRLIFTFSRAVRHLDMVPFERELLELKDRLNARCQLGRAHADCYIPTHELRELVVRYKEIFEEQTGEPFPQEPEKQLWEAVHAASSNMGHDAGDCPRPVTVQTTIFSNFDFKSAVGITLPGRQPGDDEDSYSQLVRGKWLVNAQIGDMSSERIPQQITQEGSCEWAQEQGIAESERLDEFPSLEETMPGIFAQLLRCQDIVENRFADAPGLEFAIHQGQLWVLQAHSRDPAPPCPQLESRPLLDSDLNSNSSMTTAAPTDIALDMSDSEQVQLEPQDGSLCQIAFNFALDASDSISGIHEDVSMDASDQSTPFGTEPDCCGKQEEASGGLVPRTREGQHTLSGQPMTSLMWQALSRLCRRMRKDSSPANVVECEAVGQAEDQAAKQWLLATPCGLALWQTGLAGGTAAVTCRTLGLSIGALADTSKMRPSTVLRSFIAPTGPIRAFPFGFICCTAYSNLCSATPADDSQNSWSPVWRLGCAASAVSMSTVLTQPANQGGGVVLGPFGRQFPSLTRMVPQMAIEMCVIDMVKNAAVARGHDVSVGVLVLSGAAAGTVAQTIMHPLSNMCRSPPEVQVIGNSAHGASAALRVMAQEGPSMLFAGLGKACIKSVPVVAMNSLVRVGMTTHFLSLTSSRP